MTLIFADDIADITTTTGTGALTLANTLPTPTDRTFGQVMATGDTVYARIRHQTLAEWEIGLYTYSAADTLTRSQILGSSNSNSAVNFSAGNKLVDLHIPENLVGNLIATPVKVGGRAGESATGSDNAVFIGGLAGRVASSCDFATMIGQQAGASAVNSANLVAVGRSAAEASNALPSSLVIGNSAGRNATNSSNVLIAGAAAGYSLTGSQYATVVGANAGENMQNSQYVTAVGASAARNAVNCEHMIAIGTQAMGGSDPGDGLNTPYSVWIGYSAGRHVHDNSYSVTLGYAAGEYANFSNQSVMIGLFAGIYGPDSGNAIYVGSEAGLNAGASPRSILIGTRAGFSQFTDSAPGIPLVATDAIYIGTRAGAISRNSTDLILIGRDSAASDGLTNAVGIGAGVQVTESNTFVIPDTLTLKAQGDADVGGALTADSAAIGTDASVGGNLAGATASFSGPVTVANYTVATVPDASTADFQIIGVTDEVNGPCLAVSFGGGWRALTLGPVIS